MNHTLGPGSRLNIDALAKTLGVSPTPVREALARIEAEGLIVKGPTRGYLVAPLIRLEDLHSLIDFRLLIEPAAAAQPPDGRLQRKPPTCWRWPAVGARTTAMTPLSTGAA